MHYADKHLTSPLCLYKNTANIFVSFSCSAYLHDTHATQTSDTATNAAFPECTVHDLSDTSPALSVPLLSCVILQRLRHHSLTARKTQQLRKKKERTVCRQISPVYCLVCVLCLPLHSIYTSKVLPTSNLTYNHNTCTHARTHARVTK